jgi:hypothetical protein
MPCSPHLRGVDEPLEVLRIVHRHPVLLCSEPSRAFYPLRDKGWVVYGEGRWRITEEGRGALENSEDETDLPEFFEL